MQGFGTVDHLRNGVVLYANPSNSPLTAASTPVPPPVVTDVSEVMTYNAAPNIGDSAGTLYCRRIEDSGVVTVTYTFDILICASNIDPINGTRCTWVTNAAFGPPAGWGPLAFQFSAVARLGILNPTYAYQCYASFNEDGSGSMNIWLLPGASNANNGHLYTTVSFTM